VSIPGPAGAVILNLTLSGSKQLRDDPYDNANGIFNPLAPEFPFKF